jgi:hypothetical protein
VSAIGCFVASAGLEDATDVVPDSWSRIWTFVASAGLGEATDVVPAEFGIILGGQMVGAQIVSRAIVERKERAGPAGPMWMGIEF